jgi:hypothetical protein
MKEVANQGGPSHKSDNQPHRDQGVYASNGDAEIKTGHDALPLDPFAGHCTSSCNCPIQIHHAGTGISFR